MRSPSHVSVEIAAGKPTTNTCTTNKSIHKNLLYTRYSELANQPGTGHRTPHQPPDRWPMACTHKSGLLQNCRGEAQWQPGTDAAVRRRKRVGHLRGKSQGSGGERVAGVASAGLAHRGSAWEACPIRFHLGQGWIYLN